MAGRGIQVDDKRVRRALKDLARSGAPRALADALNRTAFEIREAAGDQVGKALEFKSGSTKSFLANPKSFLVDRASPNQLEAGVFAKDRAAAVLAIHEKGGTVTDDDGRTLSLGDKVAIPVSVKPNARGRVPKSKTPSALLGSGRAFISKSGRALVERKGGRKNPRYEVAYALVDQFEDDPRLGFLRTAEQVILRVFPEKVQRALEKLLG